MRARLDQNVVSYGACVYVKLQIYIIVSMTLTNER